MSYKIPVGAAVETVVTWLLDHAGFLFAWLDDRIYALVVGVETILSWLPFWLFLLLAVALAWKMAGRGLALFTLLGFPLIYNLGLWTASLQTLSLIVTAQLITVVVGVPLGVFMAKNDIIDQVMRPILDFMQTMPAFVYLIPAVMFFSLGRVPGVIATIIFAYGASHSIRDQTSARRPHRGWAGLWFYFYANALESAVAPRDPNYFGWIKPVHHVGPFYGRNLGHDWCRRLGFRGVEGRATCASGSWI